MIEKTKENHMVKFIYTAELIGKEAISKTLGEDFSFFNRASIISGEFDAEHEANVQMNFILKQHEANTDQVAMKIDRKNTVYYSNLEGDTGDWEELVIRHVSLVSIEPGDNQTLASGRLHIIPQMKSFEISKLNPTIIH